MRAREMMAQSQKQVAAVQAQQVVTQQPPDQAQQGGQKRPEVAAALPPPEVAPRRPCSIMIASPSGAIVSGGGFQQQQQPPQQAHLQVAAGSVSPVLLKVQQTIPRTFSASALGAAPARRPSGSGREQRFSFWDSLVSSSSLDKRSKSQCLQQMEAAASNCGASTSNRCHLQHTSHHHHHHHHHQAAASAAVVAHLHLQPQRLDIKR